MQVRSGRLSRMIRTHPDCAHALGLGVVSAVLAGIMTWPVVANLTTHIPGAGMVQDFPVYLWNLWWGQAMWDHWWPNPFYTDFQFYPLGTSLTHSLSSPYYAALGLPLIPIVGLVAALNLIMLMTFVTTAVITFLLFRYLDMPRSAAWVAALVHAFSPYRMFRVRAHLDMLKGDLFALYILALFILLTPKRWRRGMILAGLSMTACFYATVEGAIYPFVFTVLFLGWFWRPWQRSDRAKHLALGLAGAACFAAILASPYLIEFHKTRVSGNYFRAEGDTVLSADLLGFVVPPENGTLWRACADGFNTESMLRQEAVTFLGYFALALMLIGFFSRSKINHAGFWRLALIVFALLSLGPLLNVNGTNMLFKNVFPPNGIEIHMPQTFVDHIPVLGDSRAHSRYHEMTCLAFAFVVGLGFSKLARWRWLEAVPKPLLAIVVVVVCLVEYAVVPVPMTPTSEKVFAEVKADPEDYAVLDGSLFYDPCIKLHRSIANQPFHEKRNITGYISRVPPAIYGYLMTTPVLKEFASRASSPATIETFVQRPDAPEMMENILDLLDIRYFVINEDDEQYKLKLFEGVVPFELAASSDRVWLYRLERPERHGIRPNRIVVGEHEWSVYLANGWGQWHRTTETVADGRQAIWSTLPRSTVLFRIDHSADVAFECDMYLPESVGSVGSVRSVGPVLTVNSVNVEVPHVAPGISTHRVTLPQHAVKPGLNEIAFEWDYSDNEFWWDGGKVRPDIVLTTAAGRNTSKTGYVAINGQVRYNTRSGLNLVQLSGKGTRVRGSGYWDPMQSDDLVEYVRRIPKGRLVALLSTANATGNLSEEAWEALGTLGFSRIDEDAPMLHVAGLGTKGASPGTAMTVTGTDGPVSLAPGHCAFIEFRFSVIGHTL